MKKVLLMISLAVFAIVNAQDTPDVAADPVVIRVAETEETRSTFDNRFEIAIRSIAASQGIALNDALRVQLEGFKPQFLDRRVTELILLKEASARGIAVEEAEVEAQLDSIKASLPAGVELDAFLTEGGFADEAQLRTYVEESQLLQATVDTLQSEIEISEAQISEAYEARQAEFSSEEEICARHILLETEEEAQLVIEDLAAGADFVELAKERSTGPSAPRGGDLNCYGRGMMVPPFEAASFDAELNTPIGPVETQFGFHVILVYDRKEPVVQPIEEVSEQLKQSLKDEQFNLVMETLRSATEFEMFPENLIVEVVEENNEDTAQESSEQSQDAEQNNKDESSQSEGEGQ